MSYINLDVSKTLGQDLKVNEIQCNTFEALAAIIDTLEADTLAFTETLTAPVVQENLTRYSYGSFEATFTGSMLSVASVDVTIKYQLTGESVTLYVPSIIFPVTAGASSYISSTTIPVELVPATSTVQVCGALYLPGASQSLLHSCHVRSDAVIRFNQYIDATLATGLPGQTSITTSACSITYLRN